MYRLTPRMEQHFRKSLASYHQLFDGGRCQGWELEELIVKAIKNDTTANHLPRWQEAGHDDREDILVIANNKKYQLQIKSGQIKRQRLGGQLKLILSGHRLGRFNGNLSEISQYLNDRQADIISIPYRKNESELGRDHIYRLCYVPVNLLKGIQNNSWHQKGKQWQTKNVHDVLFSLRPSMSWQIWWEIPLKLITPDREFANGQFISR